MVTCIPLPKAPSVSTCIITGRKGDRLRPITDSETPICQQFQRYRMCARTTANAAVRTSDKGAARMPSVAVQAWRKTSSQTARVVRLRRQIVVIFPGNTSVRALRHARCESMEFLPSERIMGRGEVEVHTQNNLDATLAIPTPALTKPVSSVLGPKAAAACLHLLFILIPVRMRCNVRSAQLSNTNT